jgi:hypothetical protein
MPATTRNDSVLTGETKTLLSAITLAMAFAVGAHLTRARKAAVMPLYQLDKYNYLLVYRSFLN